MRKKRRLKSLLALFLSLAMCLTGLQSTATEVQAEGDDATIAEWAYTAAPESGLPTAATGGVDTAASLNLSGAGYTGYSSKSLAANNWTVDGCWLMNLNTAGYDDLTFSAKMRSSNTGPANFKLQYRTSSEGEWKDVENGVVKISSTTLSQLYNATKLPAEAANCSTLQLRLAVVDNVSVNGGTIASTGASNVNNIVVSGTKRVPKKLTSLEHLDRVYIYSNSNAQVLTETASGTKLAGVAGTVDSEGVLAFADEMAELTVAKDANGYYSFLTPDGKYLTSGATGNSLTFEDAASDYSLWVLEDAGDGSFYIKNVNASYNGNPQALEYYKGFTTYGAKETDIYKFTFYGFGKADKLPEKEESGEEGGGDEPSKTAEKVTSITQLDKVYIYSNKVAQVLTETASGSKLAGVAGSVAENKLTVEDGMVELIVAVNDEGQYSFLTAEGKYLTSGETGNSLTFADEASDYSLWTLEDAGDGSFYIKNVNAAYNGNAQALEYYNGFTTYTAKTTDVYKFTLFKSGVAESLPGGGSEENKAPVNGDYVIWAPAYSKALSSNYGSSFYNPGVDVTETDGVLSGYGNTEIWTLTKNEDDTYYISCADGKISMGDSYSSMPLNDVHDKWTLEDAGDGLWYVKNVGRGCYMEWYGKNNNWSGYGTIAAGSEGMFALKFTPAARVGYDTDSSIVEDIAQWGGGGPYDSTKNASEIYGDKYVTGDMLDTAAKFSVLADGKAGQPFIAPSGSSANYYMGGTNIGKAEGDYMQFAVNASGYGDMTLSFRMRATNAAPGSFQLQYSTDGGTTFENFTTGEYSYSYTQYTSSGSMPVTGEGTITDGVAKTSLAPTYYINFTFDVPAGAENAENLLIRLTAGNTRADGKDSAISGNMRIDTVVLKGSPIADSSITRPVTVDPDGSEDQATGTKLTMTCATEGAVISYRFVNTATGEGEWKTYDADYKPVLALLPATLEVKASCAGKADSITRVLTYSAGTVSPVRMSPNGGGVYISGESAEVTLTCETEGATIYYKVDDSDVYTEYTDPIVLESGFGKRVITAYAVKEGFNDGKEVTRTFTERSSDTYGLYFGQLHSHTNYSDGAGTAADAYEHASKVKNLDFLAVTDHSNSFDNADSASIADGSVSSEWTEGHQLAKDYTTDEFVGLFGYEMTWSNGLGHMNTFNTDGFQSRTQSAYSTYSTALQNYYSTLKTDTDSISQFNHPGTTFGDFSDFAYYDEEIDDLITIIEVGNGEGAIGSSGYFPSYEYYTRALDKGWHVAPTNNQDNHKGLWGDANTGRSVVLADSLSEEDIYDAMRNYRVYATEDNDLSITYTLNDNIMGSILDKSDVGDNAEIQVVLNDPTDDVIGRVEVIVNGGLSIADKQINESSDTVTFDVPSSYSYYYIKVTEADGDIAVTAPVWVGKVEAAGISSFTSDAVLPVQNQELNLTLDLYNNEKTPLEIQDITFTLKTKRDTEEKVIHTADLEKIKQVDAKDTASYTFPYTYDGLGAVEIYATVKATLNGVEKVYKEPLKLNYAAESMVTRVIVDGTHYNDYVTGYYGGNMNNFTSIAAESQIEVKVEKDKITSEMLKDCSLLVISAPAKKSGTANAGAYEAKPFEDDFIAMVAQYVKDGGSVVVCGLADYQDKGAANSDGHTAAQLNKLLGAIGSTIRINDDEAWDDENNGGQEYRLYPTIFNTDSEWTKGIQDGQKYSQYSGCTVDVSGGANENGITPQWLVKGFDTTYSKDTDNDGIGGVAKDEAYFLACQDSGYGGTIFAAGGVFLSDFEVKAEMDNIWDLPYANRTIAENILGAVKTELPLSTIAALRQGNLGDVFRIQGYTTSSRIEGNAFFDALYLQDETGGVTVFPIGEDGLEIGTKMEIIGYVDEYQGDKEIQVMSYKIINDEPKKIYEPVKMSNKDAMDYENNGGKLIQVEGEVVDVILGTDGKSVSQFIVKDKNGDFAKVFIDGYILSSKTGTNELASIVKKGNTVSAVGLLYLHPEGDSEESVAVLRVRDCAEVLLLEEASGSGEGGEGSGGTGGGNGNGQNGTSANGSSSGANGGSNVSAKKNTSAATGDSSNMLIWIVIMLGAAAAITIVVVRKRKMH